MASFQNHSNRKVDVRIIGLLIINLVVGMLVFKDYGLSLDEPLYYAYGEAIGYAYSPAEWFSGDFVITRAYGPSPADHGNRGPAYLLVARLPAHVLQVLGFDLASSWHLINFLTFQVGLYFFYVLCKRWMKPWPALGTTAFMAWQPVLWEHAFINPKDPPFLVFFLITLELGFRMADRLARSETAPGRPGELRTILLPAIMLGLTTNLRVIGPLAGVLTGIYYLSLGRRKRIWWFLAYGLIAYLVMVLTWPYLWENPIEKFVQVLRFMSDNPTQLRVLFYGQLYPADQLPLRYLPALMLFTLTEPVWPLAAAGVIIAVIRTFRKTIAWRSLALTSAWFLIPFVYVLLKRPPMYDGFRHFLFIVPPIFVLAGLTFDALWNTRVPTWLAWTLMVATLIPGIYSDIHLHPYQYTYYNRFIGGTGEAGYQFETDYWLTCYKEAMEQLAPYADDHLTLYVHREFYIAAYYAPENITVKDYQTSKKSIQPGDYVLMSSRANPSLQRYRNPGQVVLRVGRDGTLFCVTQRQ